MNLFDLNTKNEETILKAHKRAQLTNLIVCSIFAFVGFVLTLVFIMEDYDFEEWIIPFGAHALFVGIFFLIRNRLQIHYGMYYDIRMIRLAAEKKGVKNAPATDVLPEL